MNKSIEGGKLKIVLVAEHASQKFGGEAVLPFHYFRILKKRDVEVKMIIHDRTKNELTIAFPDAEGQLIFIDDIWINKLAAALGGKFPSRLSYFTFEWISRIVNQLRTKRKLLELVKNQSIDIVHQVIPVSPKEPSFIFDVGVPVIIGPMNGGIDYPAGFKKNQKKIVGIFLFFAGFMVEILNKLIPGKYRADALLVANDRTKNSLPKIDSEKIYSLIENGVDLGLWGRDGDDRPVPNTEICHFVYIGRLVDWKGVEFLIKAFSEIGNLNSSTLLIVGDGDCFDSLKNKAYQLNLLGSDFGEIERGKIHFVGWKSQVQCAEILKNSDVLVLPSLMECGGAVVLEAMATALPVIATNWGGPADYLDDSCGRLVEPSSPEKFVDGLVCAMDELAADPKLRAKMGKSGREKVVQFYDWERKVDRMLDIYEETVAGYQRKHQQTK